MDKEIAEKIFKALNEDEIKHILEDDITEVIYQLSSINSRAERIRKLRFKMNDTFFDINKFIDYIEEQEVFDILESLESTYNENNRSIV